MRVALRFIRNVVSYGTTVDTKVYAERFIGIDADTRMNTRSRFRLFSFFHGGLESRMEYAARISCENPRCIMYSHFLSRCICHCKSTHRHVSQFTYDWPPQINFLYRNGLDLRVCVNRALILCFCS